VNSDSKYYALNLLIIVAGYVHTFSKFRAESVHYKRPVCHQWAVHQPVLCERAQADISLFLSRCPQRQPLGSKKQELGNVLCHSLPTRVCPSYMLSPRPLLVCSENARGLFPQIWGLFVLPKSLLPFTPRPNGN